MTDDPTARLASNIPLDVTDKIIMDQGISDKVKLLCHVRKTVLNLYGMFVELLRYFYSDPNNLPVEIAECATWNSDPTKTKIWIDSEFKWEDTAVELRPAIYVKLGELSFKPVGSRVDGLIGVDLEEGEYHYAKEGSGTATLVHVGSNKGEAVTLAMTTFDFLDGFGSVIRDDLNFRTFYPASIVPIQVNKESKERYISSVNVVFTFSETWSLKMESPKLKRVIFNTGQ